MTLLHFIPGWYKWALENGTARNGLRELTCIRSQISDLYFDSPLVSAAIHWEKDGSDSLYRAEQMSALVLRGLLRSWIACGSVQSQLTSVYCYGNLRRGDFYTAC